ncbi:MAG: hybrid sensor histidine kinase/response regulator [Elainellaceae cyanobacterium]
MFIEDDELRSIFKAASEEHLQNLDNGLLHLEKHPDDQEILGLLLREAHSLKGDANMLGVKEIGALAHQIEHVFTQLKQQQMPFSQELGDRLAHSMAAIHKLVEESVTGEPAEVNSFQVLAVLMGAEEQEQEQEQEQENEGKVESKENEEDAEETGDLRSELTVEPANLPSAISVPVSSLPPSFAPPVSSASPSLLPPASTYRIETIRVSTRSLDDLMTQAGELTVTKIRIAHRLAEIEAIASLWEEWSRELLNYRFSRSSNQAKNGILSPGTIGQTGNASSRAEHYLEQMDVLIGGLRNALYEDTTRLELIGNELEEGIRTLRLLPFSTIFNLFPRLVRDLARQEGKQVELIINGGETCADKRILEEIKDPLMHLLRNAIDHGIEPASERSQLGKPATATIHLRSYQTPTHLVIEVKDDGRGLDLNRIKQTALKRGICREEDFTTLLPSQIQSLIFTPGFSTAPLVTEVSGRGVGLDVVQTNVEKLKGSVQVESTLGQGCLFRIQLSITLATAHVLIVLVNDTPYAIPVEFVRMACLISAPDIFTLEGRETVVREGQPISVARLADLLELTADRSRLFSKTAQPQQIACLILQVGQDCLGLLVDAVVDEQDVVIKPQSQLLKRVRNVSGATILGTGEVCIVLNPQDLIKSVQRRSPSLALNPTAEPAAGKQTILLVEDSIATRTQEKRMLEAAGYEVVTAVDGNDGLTKLQTRSFDAVISDVQMPNLDGLQLTSKIRQYREYDELPVILVTSLTSDEDKRRGAEAGANAYITKSSLNQDILIETLHRLM